MVYLKHGSHRDSYLKYTSLTKELYEATPLNTIMVTATTPSSIVKEQSPDADIFFLLQDCGISRSGALYIIQHSGLKKDQRIILAAALLMYSVLLLLLLLVSPLIFPKHIFNLLWEFRMLSLTTGLVLWLSLDLTAENPMCCITPMGPLETWISLCFHCWFDLWFFFNNLLLNITLNLGI